ncbi:Solute carrier family 49 member A3 [Holothuria leucospilota]|uniref:Solute carrier family 49 member A3 n=1 Tax=Holothuria leucospilota TaxID=206669 RepID=A0A9Q0YQV8_HOLLE|nr:Solute carrier family 49 member A3 [Holothuria leucospilota]
MEMLEYSRTYTDRLICDFDEAAHLVAEMSSSKQPLLVRSQDENYHYNSLNSEDSGKKNEIVEYRPHPLRWYILAVLCVMNFSNAMAWITFAPVANIAAAFYKTNEDVINGLSVVFMVATIPFGLVAIWVLDTHGLRTAFVAGSWLNFIGLVIRYLSTLEVMFAHNIQVYVVFIGQSLAAMAQAFFLFASTKLAATWFPDNHRALANTIGTTSNPVGILATFVASPLIVQQPEDMRLMLFWYIMPGAMGCLMATLCIYRGVPPRPPSPSAAMAHEPFFKGVKELFQNKAYVMLFIAFGAGFGLFSSLSSLLPQIVCVKGYSEEFSDICGALIIVAGLIGAVVAGIYVDITKKFGLAGKVSFTLAVIFICLFYMASQLENQNVLVAVSMAGFGFFGFANLPVSYELGVETTYPIAEGTSGGFLAMSGQIQGIIMVLVGQSLAVDVSPQDMDIQQCSVNTTTGSNTSAILPTTSEPITNNVQDLKYTALFFALYAVLMTFIYIFGVRTKYHRLLAEDRDREGGVLNFRANDEDSELPPTL